MRKVFLLLSTILVFSSLSKAQLNSYGFSYSTTTYTPITGGTVHSSGGGIDDERFSVTLPFTFNFNGNAYTQIYVCENGYVSFGTTDPGSTHRSPISGTASGFEVASALGRDLGGTGSSSELRSEVIGTGTNQTFVAQFTAFGEYLGTQNYNFQIRLNQANDVAANQTIQFVYGTFSSLTSVTTQVGLRGTSNATFFNRTTTSDWGGTTNGTLNSSSCTLSSTVFPASGTTFTFTPPSVCTGTPIGGITTSSSVTSCPGTAITLNVTGATSGALGLTYQWQDSTGGGVFNDISGETNENLIIAPTTTTSYRRRIFCNGNTNDYSTPIRITLTNPTYASLPFTEGFENTWINGCGGTRIIPSNSWRNNPITSDSSWRRSDDGANGWSNTFGAYTPAASAGTFSARFHSYQTTGRGSFDLHIDCSTGSPDKRLTFDYINTSGTDFLTILLSTDSGATFNPIDFSKDTIRLRTAWSQKVWEFNSNAAKTIIRFLAKGDFGSTDIGLDNINVITLTNCFGTPSGGVTVSNTVTACPNSVFTLSVTGSNTDPAGISVQWQDSIAGGNWSDIGGATNFTLGASQIESKGYRRRISCLYSGLDSFSKPIWVPLAAPTYATLPYTESFESTWIDACGATRVVPNASWVNTPSTSDSSWRRNDDGASANWVNITSGAYTPAASAGTYSARFHSYQAANGTRGSFDLYINCSSGNADKRLTFDYINTSGSDFLTILLSTDGGATFNPIDFTKDTIRVRTAWSTRNWDFNSNSATTVLRFLARSDYGTTDIGLDNVRVITVPAIDAAAHSIVAPVGSLLVTNTGTITLKVANTGINPIDFATNNAVVGVRVTNPSGVATNYTLPVTTGGINANSTEDIVITTTANFSALGTYTLKGGITLTGDGNSLNDSTNNAFVITNPLVVSAVSSGNWGDASTWSSGTVPGLTDSVNITGFNVTLDGAAAAPYNAYSIGIGANGTLTGGPKALVVGPTGGGRRAFTLASTATLVVNAGTNITHNGFLLFSSGSNFTMSGGNLTIDGNDGTDAGSVQSSNDILGVGTSATNYSTGTFDVTGGTLTVVDPHRFSGSYAVAYRGASGKHVNFGTAHTTIFGNGTSFDVSNGAQGFLHDPYVNSGRLSYGNLTINMGSNIKRFVTHPFTYGINGNFTINVASEYRTTAGLNIGGNFINNGIYASTSTTGFLTFLNATATPCTTAQSITGTGRFRNTIPTVAINNAGTGYSVGSLIYLLGGTSTSGIGMIITSVNGTGGITGVSITNMGDYTVQPTYPAAANGGTGTGATFTVTNLLSTAAVTNLTINNTSANGVTLANTFFGYGSQTGAVSGTLTLTNGILDNAGSFILGTSTANRGTLTYTNGFVKGKFGRWFGAATNSGSTGDFPVGKDTIQNARVEFTAAPTKGGVLIAEFIKTAPGFDGLPLTDGALTLDKVATDGFWRIENDTITGGTYNLSLTGRKFVGVSVLSTLRSVKRPNNGTTWTLNGTAGTNTGSLTIPVVVRTGLSGFSEFAIAAGSDNLLPYTKLTFVGTKTANGNKLNWSVTNELNAKGYQLERSIDGINFAEINYIASKNALATPSNTEYSFTDFAPFKGNTYYRLKQLDNDGKFSYSNVVLMRGLKVTTLSIAGIYPNPTSNILNLVVTSPSDKQVTMRVVDVNGKVVMQNSRQVVNGDNALQLNIQSLTKGTYTILATCNDGCETKAHVFVKQ